MRVKLPEYFYENDLYMSDCNEEFSIVEYKVYSSNEKVYAYSEHNMMIFVLKGKKHIKVSFDEITINAGEFIIIKKGNYIMNQIVDVANDNFESIIITMSDNFIEQFVRKNIDTSILKLQSQYDAAPEINSFKYTINSYVKSELNALLINSYKKDEYARKITELKIEELLLIIINEYDSGFLKNYLLKIASNMNQDLRIFMENNYDKPLSIEELAKKSGNSLTSFKRNFSKVFNDTPKSWINKKRIEKAQYLLEYSRLNITEVCYVVGYNNLSHFIKLFKKNTGITPNIFRNTNRTGL